MSLSLIAKRDAARASGDHAEEMPLSKQIKRHVRVDRAKWLDELVAKGDWNAIKFVRGKSKRQLVTLRDDQSNIVSTEHRAELLAAYFERVQWAVRPTTLSQNSLIRRSHTIDVNCKQVTFFEFRKAVGQLKSNKQCGADGVPSEFWKTCCLPGSSSCDWILYLFDCSWSKKQVPETWHLIKDINDIQTRHVKEESRKRRWQVLMSPAAYRRCFTCS